MNVFFSFLFYFSILLVAVCLSPALSSLPLRGEKRSARDIQKQEIQRNRMARGQLSGSTLKISTLGRDSISVEDSNSTIHPPSNRLQLPMSLRTSKSSQPILIFAWMTHIKVRGLFTSCKAHLLPLSSFFFLFFCNGYKALDSRRNGYHISTCTSIGGANPRIYFPKLSCLMLCLERMS